MGACLLRRCLAALVLMAGSLAGAGWSAEQSARSDEAAAAETGAAAQQPVSAFQRLKEPPEIPPLDDPANPWAAQYSELDRELRSILLPLNASLPSGLISLELDSDGWLLPLAEAGRRAELRRQESDRRSGYSISVLSDAQTVVGQIPQFTETRDLHRRRIAERVRGAESLRPRLPDWLRYTEPFAIIALPDGSFVTQGSPGSWELGPQGSDYISSRNPRAVHNLWLRFSAAGELMGTTPLLDKLGWLRLSFTGLDELAAQLDSEQRHFKVLDGFLLVYDGPLVAEEPAGSGVMVNRSPPRLVAAYDWDGSPLDISQPLTRTGGYCLPWSDGSTTNY